MGPAGPVPPGSSPLVPPASQAQVHQAKDGFEKSGKAHNPEIHDLVVKKALNSDFELSVHRPNFYFILNALTFQSSSIWRTPVTDFSSNIMNKWFWVPKHVKNTKSPPKMFRNQVFGMWGWNSEM